MKAKQKELRIDIKNKKTFKYNKKDLKNMSETISLKEFKRKIKQAGYKYKTHVPDFSFGQPHRHLEILDKEGNFIVGSGANVYTTEMTQKHPKAFELVRKYKDRVFDEEGDKVLF